MSSRESFAGLLVLALIWPRAAYWLARWHERRRR